MMSVKQFALMLFAVVGLGFAIAPGQALAGCKLTDPSCTQSIDTEGDTTTAETAQ